MSEPGHHPSSGLLKIAILAVGGQGGGVLSDWIVQTAEQGGYAVQATSVPGVAQRTGATIYNIEMAPAADRPPVFALMPSPGDVDVVIAAELMEAGRAITRGFVTPDRTTLIASSHRILAVSEKIEPGRGIADESAVLDAARQSCRRLICFDMEDIARECGSVISASLLGAFAASETLPFERTLFENAIRDSGRGVDASLAAFSRAYGAAQNSGKTVTQPEGAPALSPKHEVTGPDALMERWHDLERRANALPAPVVEIAILGLAKVVDFQDVAYGEEYLRHVEKTLRADLAANGAGYALTRAAAKHIANAMAYDDVIRIADRKTRLSRFRRIRRDLGTPEDTITHVTEFMHPRAEEVCGMLPVRLGRWIESRPRFFRALDRVVNRGRRPRSDTVLWFAVLSALAAMRRWRRRLLRHEREQTHLHDWLEQALVTAGTDYELAVEILHCQRLVKGYSDTHSRGMSKFDRVLSAVPMLSGRADAAEWLRRLREVALKDEGEEMLDGALRTIHSFTGEQALALSDGHEPVRVPSAKRKTRQ